jgi:hypothetical protein
MTHDELESPQALVDKTALRAGITSEYIGKGYVISDELPHYRVCLASLRRFSSIVHAEALEEAAKALDAEDEHAAIIIRAMISKD